MKTKTQYLTSQKNRLKGADQMHSQIEQRTYSQPQWRRRANEEPFEASGNSKPAGNSVFDRSALLSQLDGDEDCLRKIVGIYLEDTPVQIGIIKSAIETKDIALVRSQIHSLKGASGSIAAARMGEIAFNIEKAGDIEKVTCLFQTLEDEFANLKRVLLNNRAV